MEIDPSFHGATATALAWVGVGLLLVKLITPLERRLLAGAALLLAGLFLLSRPELEIPVVVGGAGAWMLGLVMFARAGFEWRWEATSRAGPLAALLVLPPAVLGSILLVGVIVSAAAAPMRLVGRLVGA